jgi:hypothetical protein
VCTIVPGGQIFRADFSQCVGSSRCLVASVSAELWKWHTRLGHLRFELWKFDPNPRTFGNLLDGCPRGGTLPCA